MLMYNKTKLQIMKLVLGCLEMRFGLLASVYSWGLLSAAHFKGGWCSGLSDRIVHKTGD